MRKRQWKKILSVVLALAMVFSMNITAFADPAPEGEAVEQPAAEEPAPAAEEPAADEEAPAAEPAEEKAPAAEETPAAQEPAPAEETAPAEEAVPKEKSEEAAGTIPTGWTMPQGTEDSDYAVAGDTITFKNPGTLVDAYTLTLADASTANNITLDADGTVDAMVTVTVVNGSNDATAYKTITNSNTTYITLAGNTLTIAGTTYAFDESKAEDTGVAFAAVPTVTAGATSMTFTLSTAPGVAGTVKLQKYDGSSSYDDVVGAEVAIAAGETSAAFTGLTATVENEKYKAVFVPNTTCPYYLDTENSNAITVDKTAESGVVTVAAAPAPAPGVVGDGDTMYVDSTFELDADAEKFTVSGLYFTAVGGPATGSGASKNGIFTVTVSSGTVKVSLESTQEAVSINVIEDGNLIIDGDDGDTLYGSMITLTGTKTVSFDTAANTKVFKDNLFEVKGVKLSANNANTALLVSENTINKGFSINGEDDAIALDGKGLKISIAYPANPDELWNDTTGIDLDESTIVTCDDKYVMSNNKVFALGSGAEFNLEACGAEDAMGFGKTVIFGSDKDLNSGIGFKKIPEQNKYELDAYTITIPNGAILDGSVDTTKLIVYKGSEEVEDWYDKKKSAWHYDKSDLLCEYEFVLSANSGVAARELNEANYNVYGLVDSLTLGGTAEAGKTYTLYVRRVRDDSGDPLYFASAAKALGTVTMKATEKLVLTAPTNKIYFGGQGKDEDDNVTDMVQTKDLPIAFNGYTIESDGSDIYVKNAMKTDIGHIIIYIFKKSVAEANLDTIKAAEKESTTAFDTLVSGLTEGTDYWKSDSYGLKRLVSENGYYAKAFFDTDAGDQQLYSEDISSNLISFNVVAAPVTIKTKDAKGPIKTKLELGVLDGEGFTIVNKITGAEFDNSGEIDVSKLKYNDASGKDITTVSYDTAQVTTYTVSNGSVAPALVQPGQAQYVIDGIEAGKLTIFGEVEASGVTAAVDAVYYGEPESSIKDLMTVQYNNGAETKKTKNFTVKFYKASDVSDNGLVISAGSVGNTLDPKAQDAGTELAVVATLPAGTYDGYKGDKDILAAPVKFTVAKRTMDIGFTDTTNTGLHSKRNIKIDSSVSVDKAKLDYASIDTYIGGKTHAYAGTPAEPLTASSVLSKNAIVDLSYVNIKVADIYTLPISDVELTAAFAKNFEVDYSYANYKVDPAYYAYYILEYGGHEKGAVGKKTVYQTEVDKLEEDYKGSGWDLVKWSLPKELKGSTSFNSFGGAITDKNDKVDHFVAQDYDGNDAEIYWWDGAAVKSSSYDVKLGLADFEGEKVLTRPGTGDIYFYAIVAAHATNNVVIESLAPVTYDGLTHQYAIYKGKAKKGNAYDVGALTIYDTTNGHKDYLTWNVDYTVKVKNSKNASIKYDKSQSDNKSEKGSITQLFDAKKRPQVVITGKGDYKGLKATVYFDILPRDINTAGDVDPDAGKLQTFSWSHPMNYLKLGKKKGVKYSYKITDELATGKKATLKKNKDFKEDFVVYANGFGGNAYKSVDAKNLTTAGNNYGLRVEGNGNYYGEFAYPVTVVANDAVLFSELGWSAKTAAYKATGVSSDNTGFKVKASKKYNKKKLVYNTDYTATIDRSGDGTDVNDNGLAVGAGEYKVTIEMTDAFREANKAALEGLKLIDDTKILYPSVKGKKLTKKMFTITPSAKGTAFTGKNFDVSVAPKGKVTAGTDYVALPTSFKSREKTIEDALQDDEVEKQLGDAYAYFDNDGDIAYDGDAAVNKAGHNTYHSMAFNAKGVHTDTDVYEYTFNAANAQARYGSSAGNYRPGTYCLTIIGKGAYNGSNVTLTYKVNPAKLTSKNIKSLISQDAVTANINGAGTTLYLKLPYEVEAYDERTLTYDEKENKWVATGRKTDAVTQYDHVAFYHYNDGDPDEAYYVFGSKFFYVKKWSGNTKATTKAKATIVAYDYSGYMTGTKGVPATFKIDKATLSQDTTFNLGDYDTMKPDDRGDKYFVSVSDKADKDKNPKVVVYQAAQDGYGYKAIKQKTDYTFTAKAVSSNGNTVSINAGKKSSSYQIPKTITAGDFAVYTAAGKKWEIVLSGNATTLSSNLKEVKVPMELNDKQNSGTVEFTGYYINPGIQSLTVDGVAIIENGNPVQKGVGYELINLNPYGKVGTSKYTIRLTKDDTKQKGAAYAVGGEKTFSFKIVPQKSTGLVLSK